MRKWPDYDLTTHFFTFWSRRRFRITYLCAMNEYTKEICIRRFAHLLLNHAWVKMWRDRNGDKPEENREQQLGQILTSSDDGAAQQYKLSEERCKEIECSLIELIEKEKLYLDCHLTLKRLSQKLGVNRNYISRALSQSKYMSFYTLINSYRLVHAQEILQHNPTLRIEYVAFDSGFSSARVFSQIFKRYKGIPPCVFVKALSSKDYTQNKQVYI